MLKEIILPKQGLQMTEGTITKWIIPEGGEVKEGEALFEMETDKLTITIDATASGKLLKIVRGEGETVPITEVIAYVGDDADAASIPAAAAAAKPAAPAAQDKPAEAPKAVAEPAPAKAADVKPEPEKAPAKAPKAPAKVKATASTPRAKTFAEMYNVNLGKVSPTGPDGLIIARDVINFANSHQCASSVSYAVIKVCLKSFNAYCDSLSKDDEEFSKEAFIARLAEKAFAKTETFDVPAAEDICVKIFTSLLISVNAGDVLPSISVGAADENLIAPVTFVYDGEDVAADKFLGVFKKYVENPVFAFI